jgi:hypothetical protein
MPIRLVAQIPADPTQDMLFFLVTTSSPGHPSVRIRSPALVPSLSIVLLQMQLLKPLGFVSLALSCTLPCAGPHWYIVTMSVLFICLQTPSSTSVPSISRLTFTSSVTKWLLVMFVFFMFQQHLSLLMSSPKDCHLPCFMSRELSGEEIRLQDYIQDCLLVVSLDVRGFLRPQDYPPLCNTTGVTVTKT